MHHPIVVRLALAPPRAVVADVGDGVEAEGDADGEGAAVVGQEVGVGEEGGVHALGGEDLENVFFCFEEQFRFLGGFKPTSQFKKK